MATEANNQWEVQTWAELKRLAICVPEAGIALQSQFPRQSLRQSLNCHLLESQIHRRERDTDVLVSSEPTFHSSPWFGNFCDDYRELSKNEIPNGYDSGAEFTGVCINTAIYLPWLVGQLLRIGVVLKREIISDIKDAKHLSHTGRPASVIINATGLGSLSLGGVRDMKLTPARGQVVLVRNRSLPQRTYSDRDDSPTDLMYIMERPGGGGTIMGGCYELGNWDPDPDPYTSYRIMARLVQVAPEIADGKGIRNLSIIRHAVGLRPHRHGGVRLERERLDDATWIVHNYGHAGWGYQGSYGCAASVVDLVRTIQDMKTTKSQL